MSFRFKPEDFECPRFGSSVNLQMREWLAEYTNRLLDEHVKTLPEVFGNPTDFPESHRWGPIQSGVLDTHRARLWCVQEIKPEKCEHKHKRMINYSLVAETCKWAECQDCGKHLVAKWEEAE